MPWMKTPGKGMSGGGQPMGLRPAIERMVLAPPGRPGTGASRTPHHLLEGTITPASLHFERHHNGVPAIDPDRHELLIHGMVRRPTVLTLNELLRYPMETHARFVECAGNGRDLTTPQPMQESGGMLNGLLSCSEWTGVKLSTLLDDVGLAPGGRWILAEGADAAGMSRSVPMKKCLDDAMIALFQNGEPIRPEQGYPMRLLLPGYEGNANVKWLHRIKVTATPTYTKDETSKYTDLLPDGHAEQFTLELGVKSAIMRPSFGLDLAGPGLYEVSGIAWSGHAAIRRVEVSADGGRSWADAALNGPVLPKSITRFRMPWRWDGSPRVLMSRATDEAGNRQPTRNDWFAKFGVGQSYHFNALQSWAIDTAGKATNVYA
jgi:sulfane dehydrogenase subunit SoxC